MKEVKIFKDTTLLGKYRLCSIIGTGRTGVVYLAEHISLGEYRAVKVISKHTADHRQAYQEAMILKKLRHPGIPIIYDVEEDVTNYYLIEEYLEGKSLYHIVNTEGPLSMAMIVSVGIQICRLVDYLHSAKPNPILYLDLQPKNLLLCRDIVKMVDFGQAIFLNEVSSIEKRYGTVGYAAPEQYLDEDLDERTDIYAVGELLRFLRGGEDEKCFSGSKKGGDLTAIIKRCREEKREKRYQSVKELLEQLESLEHLLNLQTACGRQKITLPSLTIAVAGLSPGAGATHFSIGFAQYLTILGYPCIYEERNSSGAIMEMAEYLGCQPDSAGIVRVCGCDLRPEYGDWVKFKEPEGLWRVYDYGQDWKSAGDSCCDAVVLVAGGKWWNIKEAEKGADNIKESPGWYLVCSQATGRCRLRLSVKGAKKRCLKAPYFADPFHLNSDAADFYKALFTSITGLPKGRGRGILRYLKGKVGAFTEKLQR